MTKRNPSWDVVKAAAMFLVVFHVRVRAHGLDAYQTPVASGHFCTASAVPNFLMKSGFFLRLLFCELSESACKTAVWRFDPWANVM